MDTSFFHVYVQAFVCTSFSFLWGIYLGAESLHLIETLCWAVWGTTRLFSKAAALFSFLSAVHEGTNFSKSLPALVLIRLFNSRTLSGAKWYLIVVLICIFLMTNDVEHLFTCLLCCARSLQSCLILYNPMDCSLPGSSVHEILQTRILEWVAISFSRGSAPSRDRTDVS